MFGSFHSFKIGILKMIFGIIFLLKQHSLQNYNMNTTDILAKFVKG